MVYIDESLCVGCGVCVPACPTGAMRMVNGVAQIEQSLCRECQVCMQACPHGAVLSLVEPAGVPAPVHAPAPASIPVRPAVQSPRPAAGVGSWLGAAFDFVGREIAPRVSALLENRSPRYPAPASSRAASTSDRTNYGGRGGGGGRGRGRQGRRRRRGRW